MSHKNDEQVSLESQAPAPVAPPAPAPPATPDYEKQLAEATAKIATLEAERTVAQAEQEEKLSDLRIKAAMAAANKPTEELHLGQTDALRHKLIGQMGNARWHHMSPDARCVLLGVAGSESIKDSELQKIFGRSSDSQLAAQARRNDAARYAAWRTVAIERGIL